jgi:hypothetical protein
MDGEAWRRFRWSFVFGAVAVFGLLVVASGLTLASLPITLQGAALGAVGLVGLVLTGFGKGVLPRRLPSPLPLALPAGALVLVATAVECARTGLSPWAPLGLLTGVALLSLPIRNLPAEQRMLREPRAAVVLVVIGLVLMVGYEGLRHLLSPSAGDLPSYWAAIAMPFAVALGAGALAILAATRGGGAGIAAAGALVLVLAALNLARIAGDAWWVRHSPVAGETAAPMLAQTFGVEQSSAYQSSIGISVRTTGGSVTVFLVVGLVLVVAGWWWAAARRRAG